MNIALATARPAADKELTDIADYVLRGAPPTDLALDTARACLIDTLGCGLEALEYPACTKLLGPIVAGTVVPNGAKGGFGFTGGGGDFGSRYAWYVKVVQQKVSENWLKYEVDPRISTAQRVYVTFDVMRDGHPANVQVEQSSGVPSLDQSATRAIQRIDTFGPLPSDYAANKVSVEFWFDYKR